MTLPLLPPGRRNFFLQTSISRLFLDGVATPTVAVNHVIRRIVSKQIATGAELDVFSATSEEA